MSLGAQDVRAQAVAHSGDVSISGTVHVALPTGERGVDRASILAALEQVHPGGTIQFAPGTYQMGELLGDAVKDDKWVRITVPGVTLQGHPDGTTLRYCDPAEFPEHEVELFACDGLALEAPRQTVRGLTFEYVHDGLYVGCCFDLDAVDPASFRVGGHPGGHLIEGNTFRNSGYSIRVAGDFAEPVVIRQNRFVNTFHAIGIVGSMVHFLANDISAPEPGAVRPYPSNAIVIAPLMAIFPPPRRTLDHTYCARNIVEGNRIEGHFMGIWIGTVPGSSCVGNVIRDNTIIVQRTGAVSPPPGARMIVESDSTLIGPPLWLRPFPFDQDANDTESGVIEDNLIEGNRIIGAEGIGIEVWNASGNRFVNNTITGVVRREPFPGNFMGELNEAWRDANGSGIWLSAGSDGNEISDNTFEEIASWPVVLEGDSNVVQMLNGADAVHDLGAGNRVIVPDQ